MEHVAKIPFVEISSCVSRAMDLVSSKVSDHHRKVALISSFIADELDLDIEDKKHLFLAALMHDSGAISLKERLSALEFDIGDADRHAELGYRLLKRFQPFYRSSVIVRYHHYAWKDGAGEISNNGPVPFESHIVHLADRVSVLVNYNYEILAQSKPVCDVIRENTPAYFHPRITEAFLNVAASESFWFSLADPNITANQVYHWSGMPEIRIDHEGFLDLAKLFCQIIDFRSRFTATHSSGVSETAAEISRLCGFSEHEQTLMRIAGLLHDLGKLAVPIEVLEKPGALDEDEFNVIKKHAFLTYHLLDSVEEFEEIKSWAAYHHEHLDGTGYPFHISDHSLSPGSRIMSVADIFTAIMEDRPYRPGMKSGKAIEILDSMVKNKSLDGDIVSVLKSNFEDVVAMRSVAQYEADQEFRMFGIK